MTEQDLFNWLKDNMKVDLDHDAFYHREYEGDYEKFAVKIYLKNPASGEWVETHDTWLLLRVADEG